MKRRFFLGFFLPESSKMQLHPIVEGASMTALPTFAARSPTAPVVQKGSLGKSGTRPPSCKTGGCPLPQECFGGTRFGTGQRCWSSLSPRHYRLYHPGHGQPGEFLPIGGSGSRPHTQVCLITRAARRSGTGRRVMMKGRDVAGFTESVTTAECPRGRAKRCRVCGLEIPNDWSRPSCGLRRSPRGCA